MTETCIIGTRGSALARWQAHAVERALRASAPDLNVQVKIISTTGDRILDAPLSKIGDKGLFTKELERALLAGEVDLCVHSMKDLPAELPAGCAIIAMLPRADVRDALVCGPRLPGVRGLAEVPQGARLGTGSLRRAAQLRAAFPQIEPKGIRGNVDTRLSKAAGPDYEGAILAAAGVERMGRASDIAAYLPIEEMVPAVGQGAIGIEARTGDQRIAALCAAINDAPTRACVAGERRVMRELQGGCRVPIGACARFENGALVFDAVVLSPDGARIARSHRTADTDASPSVLAEQVLADLCAQGAEEILDAVRKAGGAA